MSSSKVQVAVRIRPQLSHEKIAFCELCVDSIAELNQLVVGRLNAKDTRIFTFDKVLNSSSLQEEIYEQCCTKLIKGLFDGFNATLLAYGQTGSGKTYTMGTNFELMPTESDFGIIPRAVHEIFSIKSQSLSMEPENLDISIDVQFMEIYNEDIYDLLDLSKDTNDKGRKSNIKIHEDEYGNISVSGLSMNHVNSEYDVIQCLKTGTLCRSTASTNMNLTSSRSHAIFIIHLKLKRLISQQEGKAYEELRAKFNFVDLAGSERLKRTGATGSRAKEGISINCGLLALGNVISALGDEGKLGCHVPYRDSKLTRLLQDSLGGNSQTMMIACVSPSDSDLIETLNTLRYADRARHIHNKLSLNRDYVGDQFTALRTEILMLKRELDKYKSACTTEDVLKENQMLLEENNNLKNKIRFLNDQISDYIRINSQYAANHKLNELSEDPNIDEKSKELIIDLYSQIEFLKSQNKEQDTKMTSSLKLNKSVHLDESISEDDKFKRIIEQAQLDVKNLNDMRTSMISQISENDDIFDEFEDDLNGDNILLDNPSNESMESEICEVSCEISIKQRLIEELECSQRKMRILREQYENKITFLELKTKAAQQERDKLLINIGANPKKCDSTNQLSDEKKLKQMESEVRELRKTQKQHRILLSNLNKCETRIIQLQNILNELKINKTQLLKKLELESKKLRDEKCLHKKEIYQMVKKQQMQDNKIKNLENEKSKKDTVLKRKIEEVESLKKRQPINVNKNNENIKLTTKSNFKKDEFLSEGYNLTWDDFMKMVEAHISRKLILLCLEKDLEFWIQQRTLTAMQLTETSQLLKFNSANGEPSSIEKYSKQILYTESQMNSINNSIRDCQDCIINIEKSKDDILNIFNQNRIIDSAYFLEQCTQEIINRGILLTQRNVENKELKAIIEESSGNFQTFQYDSEFNLLENETADILECSSPYDSLEDFEIISREVPCKPPQFYMENKKYIKIHKKPVLSVFYCSGIIYSSGKDQTVKLFDLNKQQEMQIYKDHPSSVIQVRYNQESNILFAVSAYLVKLWDTRVYKPIITLMSSGKSNRINDTGAIPNILSCPPGETNIAAIAESPNSLHHLYSAAGTSVRVWDLKMMKSIGKLHSGNQSTILSLTCDKQINSKNFYLASGSKDGSIKIYELDEKEFLNKQMIPFKQIDIEKSDGIESLCFNYDTIVCGNRNTSVQYWDINTGSLKHSYANLHNDWVTSLKIVNFNKNETSLLSSSRDGCLAITSLKLEKNQIIRDNENSFVQMGAHQSSINSLDAFADSDDSINILTASSDQTIGFWNVSKKF